MENLLLCRTIRLPTLSSMVLDRMPRSPRISKSPLNTSRLVTLAASTNEVAMWALQLYIDLSAKLPITIPGAPGVRSSIHLQPRDQHAFIYITTVPGPLFILSTRGAFFHTLVRYTCAYSRLSNTCSYIHFSSDIVHVGYLVFMCAGTWSSYISATPHTHTL